MDKFIVCSLDRDSKYMRQTAGISPNFPLNSKWCTLLKGHYFKKSLLKGHNFVNHDKASV